MAKAEEVASARKAFRAGIDKGTAWLLDQQLSNGSMAASDKGLSTYYKTPLAFIVRGEVEAAARLLKWISTRDQRDSGDFGRSNGRGAMQYNATYPNAWITCGAHKAGMYRVSYRAIKYILARQDPESGGFYRVLPDTTPPAALTGYNVYQGGVAPGGQDVLNASMSGLACLATGHVDEARATGRFLHRVYEAQPVPKKRFYFQWRDGGLITEFPEEEQIPFAIDAAQTNQNYFQIGIAAAFLSRLHLVDGDAGHVGLARRYIDVLDEYAEDRYSIGKAGKVGWGAAYVYRLTGDARYLDIALQVGHALLDLQDKSGTWVEQAEPHVQVEVTSEFVTLLSEMQEAFAAD